jgi:hypothetical protein
VRVLPPSLVRIEVSPSSVTFRANDLTFSAEPIVHLQLSRGRVLDSVLGARISGVGAVRPPEAAHSVRVFDRTAAVPPGYSREQCLSLFFRYGLAHLINQHMFRVHPNVEVAGVQVLYATLGADTRELLERALRTAGAKRVAIVDGPAPRPFAA